MPESAPLRPMPDDWQRALAVVAHPDDPEHGAAGAIEGSRAVEISDRFDRAVAPLTAHPACLSAPSGDLADPEPVRRDLAERAAQRFPRARPAAAFEVVAP